MSDAADPWSISANALINYFYFKPLQEVQGCTSIAACNYNPSATKDDGSCTSPAKDGYDCDGKKLEKGVDGATYFIRSQSAVALSKGKTHARVDLPENFEISFEITPQKTPVKAWSNIIHFTATGEVALFCIVMYQYANVSVCEGHAEGQPLEYQLPVAHTSVAPLQMTGVHCLSAVLLYSCLFICLFVNDRTVAGWETGFLEYGMFENASLRHTCQSIHNNTCDA